jgi:hypothetical protein
MRICATALRKRARNSSWIGASTITLPAEVQRCPPVRTR